MPVQQNVNRPHPLAAGFAMFSMFFGAGNSVFPLALGNYSQSLNPYAILGLFITAVGVPFLGLFAMMLFEGEYHDFFRRMGKIPGYIVACSILALIGPFGATPRCITLSYSTLSPYFPSMSLPLFSVFACLLIYGLAVQKNRLVDWLGYVLTPILLGSIAVILWKGFLAPEISLPSPYTKSHVFFHGVKEGYKTMDLMSAFFFSSVIINFLKRGNWLEGSREEQQRSLLQLAVQASLIGGGLLAFTYFGFSYIAAHQGSALQAIREEGLLGAVAANMLGPWGGVFACLAIGLACLTTAMALVTVCAQFLQKDISQDRFSYELSLGIILGITFLISTLSFQGIALFLSPLLKICYPALIALSLLNLFYKLYGFKPVKRVILPTFALTLIYSLL